MDNAYMQEDITQRQVPIHLLEPYHLSNREILMAIGAKYRYAREEMLADDELAALTRVIDMMTRASSSPVSSENVWTPIPIEILVPRDLAVEDLSLAERVIPKLKGAMPQFEAEAVEKIVKTLADAYRWEIGEGAAPEPVVPADACADLDYNWVEAYLVYRWTMQRRSASLSAGDLARLAAQHFGVIEEEGSSLPFRVMAEEVMQFYPQSANESAQSDEEEEA